MFTFHGKYLILIWIIIQATVRSNMKDKTIKRRVIFDLHNQITPTHVKLTKDTILQSLLVRWHIDSSDLSSVKIIKDTLRLGYYNNFQIHYKSLAKNNKTKTDFQEKHQSWLEEPLIFNFSAMKIKSESETNSGGRPMASYENSSDRTRRRKISTLSESMSNEECYDLTKKKLKLEGNHAGLKIFNKILNKDDADELLETTKKYSEISQMTPLNAVRLLIDLHLTQATYKALRMNSIIHGFSLYPSYEKVLEEKKKTYPAKYVVNAKKCTVQLQVLLYHTVQRLFEFLELHFDDNSHTRLILICKYGFDGTNIKTYKQDLNENEGPNTAIFCSCLVALQLVHKATNTVYWENPRPSSTRYCRPINIHFQKETADLSQKEEADLKKEIENLKDLRINGCNVGFEMNLTMIDGKVCAALNNTSSQKCFVCKTTISSLNNITELVDKVVDEASLEYGFSILHAHIRFMELVLHISYRLVLGELATWRISQKDLPKTEAQKKYIQCALRDNLGILVDVVVQGSGSSNDGNTARRFFESFEIVSNITGFDKDLLQRFHVILVVISSGYKINMEEFKIYARETAEKYANLYDFYYMPPSVHVILLHGWRIMEKLLLPIGFYSEEAQESNNKNVKRFREQFSKKVSREDTNKDMYERLFLHSDPLISSLKSLPKPKRSELTDDMKKLLVIDDILDEDELENNDIE